MTGVSFTNLVIVATVAFAAPLALGPFPKLRLPVVVLEIVLGIALGPSGLGWVKSDLPVQVLALVGLAFLLFLAGLEVELGRLRGRLLIVDRDTATHPHFWLKLEGIGYGFLIPIFFVSSGVQFDVSTLLSSASTVVQVPVFLVALFLVRGSRPSCTVGCWAITGPLLRLSCRRHR